MSIIGNKKKSERTFAFIGLDLAFLSPKYRLLISSHLNPNTGCVVGL